MADEFDSCECVWSQEFAMRRLLALLRQGQSSCTDTECTDLTNAPGILNATRNAESSNFVFLSGIMIFAVILYMLRPNSMRRPINDTQKPRSHFDGDGSNNNNGSPPPSVG